MSSGIEFIRAVESTFKSNKRLADGSVAQVPDASLFTSLDENTNSIAVIMKHVSGNLESRWTDFRTSDGEKPNRNRDDEFVNTFTSRTEVVDKWERGWNVLFHSLESLEEKDLALTLSIRGEPHSLPLALTRSLGHTCYHIGQIVQLARVLAGDNWTTLTIPKGKSDLYNQQVWKKPPA